MSKLISMTDFVLVQSKKTELYEGTQMQKCLNHANLLKQTPTLGMFVPCDDDGNVLEQCPEICACECEKMKMFRNAQSKVIFKGFRIESKKESYFAFKKITNGSVTVAFFNEVSFWEFSSKLKTIEDLIPYNLELL